MSKDYIGRLVKRFESGNNGSLSIGQSGIDWGCSYGTYQFIVRYGNVIKFLKKYFPLQAEKLYWNGLDDRPLSYWPGEQYCSSPDEITNVWLRCYNDVGAGKFFECEHDHIEQGWYIPCRERIKIRTGVDVDKVSRAYQELVWSGAVHFGGIAFADMFTAVVYEAGDFASNQGVIFDRIYQTRLEKMKEAYPNTGNRYVAGVFDGSSEVETLRPYLTQPPLRKGESSMKKVMIDPGHYGDWYNQGANPAYWESRFAWDISLKLGAYLKQKGIDVGFTRVDKEANPALVDRGRMAAGYDLFISMHSNAVAANAWAKKEEIDYPVAYVLVDDDRTDVDERSAAVGAMLAASVQEILQTKQPAEIYKWYADWDRDGDGNLNNDNYLGVLHGARMVNVPGVVLEHSFHTNTAICNKLLDESVVDALAKKDADMIAQHFGIATAGAGASESTIQTIEACNGTITITYAGGDGLNLHNTPEYGNHNISSQLHKGDQRRAVNKIYLSDGTTMYRLEEGEYITTHADYVSFVPNALTEGLVMAVSSQDGELCVRDFPNSSGGLLCTLRQGNLVEVIGEAYNQGDHWRYIRIANDQINLIGYAAAKYLQRA